VLWKVLETKNVLPFGGQLQAFDSGDVNETKVED